MAVSSLETLKGSYDDDGHQRRTGTFWTCLAHIITAVIGSGVLSIAWSIAQLGWIAAPICMLGFALVTYVSASLLADCYRSPHPVTGTRNYSYRNAVRVYLGQKKTYVCGFLQYQSMYGTGVAYVVTTATCIGAIQKSICYHKQGDAVSCGHSNMFYMFLFGCVEILLSQIPNFHHIKWLSIIAAIMSFGYSTIGLGLGISKVLENGVVKGSLGGTPTATKIQKLWLVSQGLGDLAFAYPYSLLLLEIQDTLKSPPAENKVMKKASRTAIMITTFFYLCCGGFGYAAFGDDTPGNLLTGFGSYEPYWLVDFANACIVVHLVGSYQVYSQPVFAFFEGWLTEKYPHSSIVNKSYSIPLPFTKAFNLRLLKLCVRTAYVISSTGFAMFFPYFNLILGMLGALNFWTLAIYFPVGMYFVQNKIGAWSRRWVVLQIFSTVCLIVSLLGLIGSIQGLIAAKIGLESMTLPRGIDETTWKIDYL